MQKAQIISSEPDEQGHWGKFGGRYVPETLVAPLEELTSEFTRARGDSNFLRELNALLRDYAGRPTPLFHAQRLTAHAGGAQIYLKREDLLHTGAHKINNALGQGLLARRMGKQRVIAETGAGQHGVATATVPPDGPRFSECHWTRSARTNFVCNRQVAAGAGCMRRRRVECDRIVSS